jgi:hypothetical protein
MLSWLIEGATPLMSSDYIRWLRNLAKFNRKLLPVRRLA